MYLAGLQSGGMGDVEADLIALATDPNGTLLKLPGVATSDWNPATWDWHEWALAAVGVYLAGKLVLSGATKATEPFRRRAKKRKRRKEARTRYERALESIG